MKKLLASYQDIYGNVKHEVLLVKNRKEAFAFALDIANDNDIIINNVDFDKERSVHGFRNNKKVANFIFVCIGNKKYKELLEEDD